jgi:hypothetical protein
VPSTDAEIPYSTLAHFADKALYVAKHQGRNRAIVIGTAGDIDANDSVAGASRPEARGVVQRTPIRMPAASI